MANKIVKSNTKVKVYNNIFNSVGFEIANGRHIELPSNGAWKEIKVEDLDYLLTIAPAMLKEGILYIEDKDIREYLDIEEYYKEGIVIASSEFDKLLSEEPDKLEEKLKRASKSTKKEVAKKAKEKADDLTGGQVKVIEKESGMEVAEKI